MHWLPYNALHAMDVVCFTRYTMMQWMPYNVLVHQALKEQKGS